MTFKNLPKFFDEEIVETSNRIARLGFFTSRKDIPQLKVTGSSMQIMLFDKPIDYDFYN